HTLHHTSPAPFPSLNSSPIDRNPPACPRTPSSRRRRNTSPSRASHEDRQVDKFEDCAGERNGFFDSKVLSRHMEVWEDGGKTYIKDITSSNGTFINDERLSSEGHESDPFELKSDDIAALIDITGENNKTIIHDQAARHDTHVAARAEQHQRMHSFSGTDRGLHVQQHLGIAGLGGVGGIGVGGQPPDVIEGLGGMNGGRKRKRSPSNTVPNLPKASAAWMVSACGPLARRA
ncbi:hypothetical protein CVT25_014222, partial [Psilocybe cyanescens]